MPFTEKSTWLLDKRDGSVLIYSANRLNISKDWKWISYWSFTGLGHTLQTVICEVWHFSWLKKLNYSILLRLISKWCRLHRSDFLLLAFIKHRLLDALTLTTIIHVQYVSYLQNREYREILNRLLSKLNRLKIWSRPSITTWQPRYHLFVTVSTHIPPHFHPLILSLP